VIIAAHLKQGLVVPELTHTRAFTIESLLGSAVDAEVDVTPSSPFRVSLLPSINGDIIIQQKIIVK
jgi:hypothetical protein